MVSGGPDSVAMLRVLVDLGSRPVVLHVDHGLRGEESREDARFVRDLCGRLKVPWFGRVIEQGRDARIGPFLALQPSRAVARSLAELGPATVVLAEAEGLPAHARSAALRLNGGVR